MSRNQEKRESIKKEKNLISLYFGALRHIQKIPAAEFMKKHKALFQEAQKTGDYVAVTQSYYSVMTPLIEHGYGTNLHFCPPEYASQSRDDALLAMHKKAVNLLNLYPSKHCLDVGCGIGGMMRDVALYSGAKVTGVTIGHNEIEENNKLNKESKLDNLCHAVQGDFYNIPNADIIANSFDAAYAVYALKYFIDLGPVLKNIQKVLKKGGLFLIYDIIKTPNYDSSNKEHANVVENFEYACGMPPLHTSEDIIRKAQEAGLEIVSNFDLSHQYKWTHFFDRPLLKMLLRSRIIAVLIKIAECIRILPKGFSAFYGVFVKGTVLQIIESCEKDLLSGSNVLIFKK